MFNKILWTLDNQLDDASFEKLCSDLLSREGYYKIIPIGGNYDGGRDAEFRSAKDYHYFQYSLEKNWENKLKKEFNKISNLQKVISKYLFVTSRKVTGNKKDHWEQIFFEKLGIELIIYDREWLRHRLEENHPDLAEKYLNIPITESLRFKTKSIDGIDKYKPSLAWKLYKEENYEEAIVEFKKLLRNDSENPSILVSISHCLYMLLRYDEALDFINRAIILAGETDYLLSHKACILAEAGIRFHSKAKLLTAREIFANITEKKGTSINHYNFGNTLSALGEYELAQSEYLSAIEGDKSNAEIWKNLGSVYSHLGQHEKEIECYNKALSINPDLPQAKVSKAITLFTVFNKPSACIKILDELIKFDDSITKIWPHIWYWLSFAYYKKKDYLKAYDIVEKGLFEFPDHYGLIDIKYVLIIKLWKNDKNLIPESIHFLKFRQKLYPKNIENFLELSKIYKSQKQYEKIVEEFNLLLNLTKIDSYDYFLSNKHKMLDKMLRNLKYIDIYQNFREISPISRYFDMLGDDLIDEQYFNEFLFLDFFSTFSDGCKLIQKNYQSKKKIDLWAFHTRILNGVKGALKRLVNIIVKSTKPNSNEHKIEIMTRLIANPMMIALLEVSGQCGYLGGYFHFSDKQMSELTSARFNDQARFTNNFISKLLESTNNEYQLLKK